MRQFESIKGTISGMLTLSLGSALLSACGGSDAGSSNSAAPAASTPTQTLSLSLALPASPDSAQPTFHLAPVLLEEPSDADRVDPAATASLAPHHTAVDPELAQLSTRRLTRQMIRQVQETGYTPVAAVAQGTEADPMASAAGVTVFTPAQIRAAYGLPALPDTNASITTAQAAQLGAGQTIYILDAYDDPNAAAELAAFSSKFGLPACTVTTLGASAALPLPAAAATGCTFAVAYATTAGALTGTAPAYDAGWATEIAIDVQWAHAIAPYARIVLVESPDANVSTFYAAAHLVNSMGPGVVSMSFGSVEGSWTSSYDANFAASNMTYLAATGDAGAEVEWPAVSANVVAVSGTTLNYTGTGTRTETVWSGTGGGVSAYTAAPAYQGLAVQGLSKPVHRQVADVSFNANPYSGQYIAVMARGTTTPAWMSAGGTSLATPQWAGIVAVVNALRAQNAKAPIGAAQSMLYGLATQQANYKSNFLDVTTGSDGICPTCTAGYGYDLPSGLGTPYGATLLPTLAGAQTAAAPVVTSASVSGKTGSALIFTVSATAPHAVTFTLNSAPTGMTINASTGVVTWNAPVAGNYTLGVLAFDAQTGLYGQGTISVSIIAPQPPVVAGGAVSGVAQTPLSFTTQVTDANAVTYSLSSAPTGMTVSAAGIVSWPAPLAGTYAVTVTARDATTGLSGHATYTVTIAAQKAPTVAATNISGTAGKALAYVANVPWSNPLSFSLSGAPAGMAIGGTTGQITWNAPTAGTFVVTVTAKDTKTGLSGSGKYTVTITTAGPVIQAASFSGVAGKSFSGSVTVTDTAATWASVTIGGVPAGMTVTVSGNTLSFKWTSPVTGSHSLHVTVADAKSLTSSVNLPLVISSH